MTPGSLWAKLPFPEKNERTKNARMKQVHVFIVVTLILDRLSRSGRVPSLHFEEISKTVDVVELLGHRSRKIEQRGRVALGHSGRQRSRLKFVCQSCPVPTKLFEVQQRKSGENQTGVNWVPRKRSSQIRTLLKSLLLFKKKVAFAKLALYTRVCGSGNTETHRASTQPAQSKWGACAAAQTRVAIDVQ